MSLTQHIHRRKEGQRPKHVPFPQSAKRLDGGRDVPSIVYEVLHSHGQPLDAVAREFFEPRFGHDFSNVRTHTDTKAAASAASVGAAAYTVGAEVVFGAGRYAPRTAAGQSLLAHELTHVVQQRHVPRGFPSQLVIGDARGVDYEVEAAHIERVVPASTPRSTLPPATCAVLQRQSLCGPEAGASPQGTGQVIEDYEQQVCRPALSDEATASIPESDLVDGEFWISPPGLRIGAAPIFDDEDTSAIVGFRYSSGGYYEIYDLEGRVVEVGEPGLETPLIDPIDLIAGGLVGVGRGLLAGGGRAAARGLALGAGRGGGAGLVRAGVVGTIRALSRRAGAAIRGVYRAIRFRGALNFTGTTIARMADPARRVPHHILKLALRFGTRTADPQGVAGAFRYVIPMIRRGRQYTLEVVIREADRTVLHFLYK